MSEPRVFLGPGGRVSRPSQQHQDGSTTMSIYFPFVVSDAIAIFTNIVAPGLDPFSVSAQSRREVFWPLIKRMTNHPKVVDPVAANGSADIGDQVEALMQALDEAFDGHAKNVYINCAGTLVGVNTSQIHQFLELSEKVFHLWKNRNEGARSDDGSQKSPALIRTPGQREHILRHPGAYVAAELEAQSPARPMPTSPPRFGAAERRASSGLLSPSRTSDASTGRMRMEDMTRQFMPIVPVHDMNDVDYAQAAITIPGAIQEANPLPLSEIWRATIYRLYSEQNESLTKYRRPNWLFHLESHSIRTVGDLGGWRGDDDSTRQLATNLITKLQETGYGTKGLQSRLKAITTVDIVEALENMKNGRMEKYRPGPILGKRVTPIKWSAYNVNGANGSDDSPVQMQIMSEAGDDTPTDTLKRQGDSGVGMGEGGVGGVYSNGAHPIRIKRKRTSSPTRESLTLVIPPETGDTPAGTPSRPPPSSSAMGGFTPINLNRSASSASMMPPPPSSFERSASAPTLPHSSSMHPSPSPAPLAHPYQSLPPLSQVQQQHAPRQRSPVLEPAGSEEDYDYDGHDESLVAKLEDISENLEDLRKEIREVKRTGSDSASIVEKAAKEVFDSFTKDFHEDYIKVRNSARENQQRIEHLESDRTRDMETKLKIQALQHQMELFEVEIKTLNDKLERGGRSGGDDDRQMSTIDAQVAQHMKTLERQAASIGGDNAHSRQRVDKIQSDVVEVKTEVGEVKNVVDSMNSAIKARIDKLESKLDSMDGEIGDKLRSGNHVVEAPLPTPSSPSTRRSTRSASIHVASTTEPTVRMNRVELRLEKLETDVKGRMDKVESKMESIDSDVKDVMNAVSELMRRVMSGGLPPLPPPPKQNGINMRSGRSGRSGK
ncbi:hypothetical protein H072_9391 [Dactylellina haptotyla CBS 200.50]|uniref:Uncharacterized protein n=1 Tax=Dactylellina haptotyla (strain CBS 200.50) TaxID=1284197 RepID=S8A787_DACHA|nr:hypothetical protein H072_9391 [Dactylellina haptotyla CBS 200.50]